MANGTTKDMIAKSLDSIRRSHAVLQRLVASRSQDEEILAAFRLEIEVLNAASLQSYSLNDSNDPFGRVHRRLW